MSPLTPAKMFLARRGFKANILEDGAHVIQVLLLLLLIFSTSHRSPTLPSCGGSCQYSSLSSKRALLPTRSSPLHCAVLTFKGLVWPRAARCHALGPEMPSPTSSHSLTLFLWAGWVSTINSAELLPRHWKMDYVWSLSMALLTLAKRGSAEAGTRLADIISHIHR